MACIECRRQKISCKLHSSSSSICKFCFNRNIKCIPHQLQQGKRNDIKRHPKRPQPQKRSHITNKKSRVSKFQTGQNSEESNLSTPTTDTLPKKVRQVSNQSRKNPTRHPRSTRHVKTKSDSEDDDANNAGATTPCGLPAAMDSASAFKATSLMNCRSCCLKKKDLEQETKDRQVK